MQLSTWTTQRWLTRPDAARLRGFDEGTHGLVIRQRDKTCVRFEPGTIQQDLCTAGVAEHFQMRMCIAHPTDCGSLCGEVFGSSF